MNLNDEMRADFQRLPEREKILLRYILRALVKSLEALGAQYIANHLHHLLMLEKTP